MSAGPGDETRAEHIGGRRRLDGPIHLAEPDPAWAAAFEREAARLRSTLAGRALAVEHVGSTAVPGLAAKPIIDIVLVVADPADEPAYVPALEQAGYELRIREPDWHEHRVLKGPDTDVNVHVFGAGCPEIVRMTTFRDVLRGDDDLRHRYEAVKRQLATRRWGYVQDYADAKTEVIDEVLATAAVRTRRG